VFAVGSLEGDSLTAVVGVDAMAAPATDTVGGDGLASPTPSSALLLVVAGLAAFAGALRLATARARR